MNTIDQVWATLCNMKYKGYILSFLLQKYQKLDRQINIYLAIASSGSIAAWAIWQQIPFVWAGIIAFSQVLTVIKPYLSYHKVAKEINKRSFKLDLLNNEYLRFWNMVHKGELTDKDMEQKYFDYNNMFAEILNFPDDVVLEESHKMEKEANLRMKNYLKTYHGIEIKI